VRLWNSNEDSEYFLEVCDCRALSNRQPSGKRVSVQKEEAMVRSIFVATVIAVVAFQLGAARAQRNIDVDGGQRTDFPHDA
jgi:hypothetical protein